MNGVEFVNLKPFIVPMLVDKDVSEHFTVVVAVEVFDEDARHMVRDLLPRLRHRVYQELLRIVTFRRRGAKLLTIDNIKSRLNFVVMEVVGDKVIKALLVLQAFHRRPS